MASVWASSQCTIAWRLRMWSSSSWVPSRTRRSWTSEVRANASFSVWTISAWCSAGTMSSSASRGSATKYSATRSARVSSSTEYLLLQQLLRLGGDALGHASRAVAQDLVDLGGQLAGGRAPALGSGELGVVPGELVAVLVGGAALVGLGDVRQRDRLAAVDLADALVVGQVDADRGDRSGIPGFDHHVDRGGGHPQYHRLSIGRGNRHPVLEPLGLLGEPADARGLLDVDVVDQALPCALDAAGVHVDLDEAVHRVDGRVGGLDPGDVERDAVGVFAGAIPVDQRGQGRGECRRGQRNRRLEVAHDPRQLGPVAAAGAIHLLDQPAVLFHQPRVERVALLEALEIGLGHAGVEIVGAVAQDVAARAGRLSA